MKRPEFNEKTEVKVIDKEESLGFYGARGIVKKIGVIIDDSTNSTNVIDNEMLDPVQDKERIKAAYADGKEHLMTWFAFVYLADGQATWFTVDQLQPVQHKFIDIDYIREDDVVLGQKPDGTPHIRPKNTGAFEVGDIISITTKIDGANSSISWDETTGKLEIFSRTNLLDSPGALRGFYDYIKTNVEPKIPFADNPKLADLVIFGEWCVSHTVQYDKEWYNKWRIYDIWDRSINSYWTQNAVKFFCESYGLEYVEELYHGPFISWEHCRSFIGKSTAYGPNQEGIVIKNQTKIRNANVGLEGSRNPIYIKIVDEKFKEHMANKGHKQKEVDPEKQAALAKATELVESVVTEARVRKMICKLMDEGQLPSEIQPKDMGSVMKLLPKLIVDDVLKEEKETFDAASSLVESVGKLISTTTAKHARNIVVGK